MMFAPLVLAAISVASVEFAGFFPRPEEPNGLSDITWIGDNRYYAVNDDNGSIYPVVLDVDCSSGVITNAVVGEPVKGEVGKDFEGCAFDRITRRLWISDERDSSVRDFDPKSGRTYSQVVLPDNVHTNTRWNYAFESVTISPDALTMWIANEEALIGDGGRSNSKTGTVVRLMRFTRRDGSEEWKSAGQCGYLTDSWTEKSNPSGLNCCGVSGLAALEDGSLIVLERELSGLTFRFRLYHVTPGETCWPDIVGKRLLYSYKGTFSLFRSNNELGNFEGLALGPKLKDGSRLLVLVSDAGDKYMTKSLFLTLRLRFPSGL